MALIHIIDFGNLGDQRGDLVAIQNGDGLPFELKRVYYIFNTAKNTPRGFHAHKELQQVAVCVSGSCKMLLDNGKEKNVVLMEDPFKGVLIDRLVWHEMFEFSDDCVLLVLASDVYRESDYIRDYEEFHRFL